MTYKTLPKRHSAKTSVERIGLLVVGMHRSGTSAATKIISLLGAKLPSNLMPAHTEFNAAGYWESQDVVELNDEVLAAAGSHWDDVLPIDPDALPVAAIARFKRRARKILYRDFDDCPWFVLKDPRIGRLLRLWISVMKTSGVQPRVVIPVRHPLEVAASLHRREGFPEEKSVYLWLRHLVDTIRSSKNEPRAIVLYDELMQDWRTAVERIAQDLDMSWPNNPDTVATMIEQFLDQKLRHHTLGGIHYQNGSLVDRLAAELYVALSERISNLEDLADSIHEQLAPMEMVFAPLLRDTSQRLGLVIKEREHLANALTTQTRAVNELARLNIEFEIKCKHIEQLENLVASERAQYQHLDGELNAKIQHNALLTSEVTKLTTQLQSANSEFVKLGLEFETKCKHIEQLEKLVASERAQYQHLDGEFNAKIQHNALLTLEVTKLTTQLQSANSEFVKLDLEFETKCKHIEQLEKLVASERAQYQHLDEEFNAKIQHNALLTSEVTKLTTQLQSANSEFVKLGLEFETKCKHNVSLTVEVTELTAHLKQAQAQLANFMEQRAELDRTMKELAESMSVVTRLRTHGQYYEQNLQRNNTK